MISESQTRYGSAHTGDTARQGSVRRWRSYQASKAVGCGHEIAVPRRARCFVAGFAVTLAAGLASLARMIEAWQSPAA
jgi:hypothetical protein